jgi:hypothetical protein
MRLRLGLTVAGVLAASLIAPAGAAAATEFGDNCVADTPTPGKQPTVFELSAPTSGLPSAAPTSGVITKWKLALTPEAVVTIPQGLRVLRLNTAAKSAQIVGEASGNVVAGSNTFDARVPVQAGDRLGLYGASETYGALLCSKAGGENMLGLFEGGGSGVGSSVPYIEGKTTARVPLSAMIEPDADGDGYGDETQDKCPQAASLQTECPVVVVDSFALAKKSSILVLVSTDESAPVTVSGTAKLPKAGKSASASAKAKLKKVTHTVPAGKLVRFTLKFPASLKSALRSLPRGKSITVKLQAQAKSVAGQVSKDKAKLKLKGGS